MTPHFRFATIRLRKKSTNAVSREAERRRCAADRAARDAESAARTERLALMHPAFIITAALQAVAISQQHPEVMMASIDETFVATVCGFVAGAGA